MSIRGWLLLACAGFGVTHLVGELFGTPLLPSAELLAWVALAAYLAVAGRDAPLRVRLALGAGLVILIVLPAGALFSTVDSGGFGWVALSEAPRQSALDVAAEAVREDAPVLIAYACLALAALFLPKRRTRAGIALAVVGIGVAVAYAAVEVWHREGFPPVLAAVPPLLVAVLAFLVASRVSSWVLRAGLALLGLAAVALLGDVLDRVYLYPFYEPLDGGDAFLEPGFRYSTGNTAAPSLAATLDPPALGFALIPVIQLAAAAAITAGCLHRPATPPEPSEPAQA
ncbi:hypothetical protein [Phytohabitans houttuyneae]|uniref:hypothetical protein n=1 Tax=Phytohabitans houttuyneae TaxID=1076126 RepID=UPI0015667A26|nr:hypothetical protein [Phytohabitans houttuyneae]